MQIITRQFKPKIWAIYVSRGGTVTKIKGIIEVCKQYRQSLFCDGDSKLDKTCPVIISEEQELRLLCEEVREIHIDVLQALKVERAH